MAETLILVNSICNFQGSLLNITQHNSQGELSTKEKYRNSLEKDEVHTF